MKPVFLALFFSTTLSFSQVNLSSSLTACYALNASASEPINNLNGVLSAVTPTVDRFNTASQALHFAGIATSYVEIQNNPLLKPTNEISFSVWVNSEVLPNGTAYIVFTKNSVMNDFEAYALITFLDGTNHRFRAVKGNSGSITNVDSSTPLGINIWYHVVFTMDNSKLSMYVNGVLENVSPTNLTFDYQTGKNIYLGSTNESSYYSPFKGSMDNVRFYNRILSANEVSQLYSQDPSCVAKTDVAVRNINGDSDEIRLFPNPTAGIFSLSTNDKDIKIVSIYDVLGREVQIKNVDESGTGQIDLSEKINGIYFLKLKTNGEIYTKKIIKE